jgi:DNA-binding transcriptional LysR family regulator
MLDLNDVRMFVQVVRARSFAEAARRLGVPPNTLSRRIRELESGLDTRLMQRSTRKLTLTAAGQAFFDRCSSAVDGVLEAGRDLVAGSDTPEDRCALRRRWISWISSTSPGLRNF